MMKSKCSCRWVVLAMLLSFAASGVQQVWAHTCPANATGTGVGVNLTAFRCDGTTSLGAGTATPCETIVLQMSVSYSPLGPGGVVNSAFEGGSMTIQRIGGGFSEVVTPAGGVPLIGPADCTGAILAQDSIQVNYTITAADAAAGSVTFLALYAGGTAHIGDGDLVGQSSGTTAFIVNIESCDDGNACTIDTCDPAQGCGICVHTPVVCDDSNACTTDACDTTSGECVFTPAVVCDDNSLCTTDACDPATGECVFTPSVTCNDNNACTADSCDPATGECVFTPNVTCNDNNACTADSCDPATGECVFTPNVTCNDNNACTADSCDPATGECVFTPNVTCNDNNACTADSCDPATGECVFTPNVTCNDNNACTSDACDPATGECVFTPTVTCNDNNACTADSCDPATGECVFTPNVTCNDNSACTADSCDPATGECVFTPNVTCNDNNVCTEDTCDPATGECVFTPNVVCDDNSECTTDVCDPVEGCVHTEITCADEDECTTDTCDPATGCVFTEIPDCGGQGCTPGFWKNNAAKKGASAWTTYTPGQLVSTVFTIPACVDTANSSIKNMTLLELLSGKKYGNNLDGASRRLLKMAISAVLNDASECVDYPDTAQEIIDATNEALASCEVGEINTLMGRLDAQNNLGCSVDQQGRCSND